MTVGAPYQVSHAAFGPTILAQFLLILQQQVGRGLAMRILGTVVAFLAMFAAITAVMVATLGDDPTVAQRAAACVLAVPWYAAMWVATGQLYEHG